MDVNRENSINLLLKIIDYYFLLRITRVCKGLFLISNLVLQIV